MFTKSGWNDMSCTSELVSLKPTSLKVPLSSM